MHQWWDRVSGRERRRAAWTRQAFRELEALDRAASGPRDWRPAQGRRPRSAGWVPGVIVAVAVSLLASQVVSRLWPRADAVRTGGVWSPGVSDVSVERPADAREKRRHRPQAAPKAGSFAFLRTQDDGSPIAYDPCLPIHVEINPRTGGKDAVSLVEDALDDVTRVTGLEFVVDGITGREPDFDRGSGSGGGRPVLVGWTDPEQVSELRGRVAGLGGSVAVRDGDRLRYATGQIALDGPDLADNSEEQRIAVVLHELGHLVGLGHVDDENELMNEQNLGRQGWGPGDRYALSVLGATECQ